MTTVGDILSTVGDIINVGVFSTMEDIIFRNLSNVGRYHEYSGVIHYHGSTQITKDCIPHGTEHPPRYS